MTLGWDSIENGKLLMKKLISILFLFLLIPSCGNFLAGDDQPLERHEFIYEHIPLKLFTVISNEDHPIDSVSISFSALSNTYFNEFFVYKLIDDKGAVIDSNGLLYPRNLKVSEDGYVRFSIIDTANEKKDYELDFNPVIKCCLSEGNVFKITMPPYSTVSFKTSSRPDICLTDWNKYVPVDKDTTLNCFYSEQIERWFCYTQKNNYLSLDSTVSCHFFYQPDSTALINSCLTSSCLKKLSCVMNCYRTYYHPNLDSTWIVFFNRQNEPKVQYLDSNLKKGNVKFFLDYSLSGQSSYGTDSVIIDATLMY
ncbi:MAG: hypothetical protein M0P13_10310 [Fibrobacteraceae bacterium]|nr:hypothetical protein [Fibrobacteraceae bacterium]